MVGSSQAGPGPICICYRGEETAAHAGRLYDRLEARFGANVFMDIHSIKPGDDFTMVIRKAVSECNVLLVLIGRDWSAITDSSGRRRIDNADDMVRVEIETALLADITIVPVLIDDAVMPQATDLPPSLRSLTRLKALTLRHTSFSSDWERLLAILQDIPTGGTSSLAASPSTSETPRELDRPKIFLCYRREDTQGFARGIYESLASKYGHEHVFCDIDSTPLGVRYSTWIESRVGQCNVMIVLIGSAWLSAKDHTGQRRLDLSEDWVRQEIETALRRNIPIIPVLVQGAPVPPEDELPPSIADLRGFQSAEVTDTRWAFDIGQLLQGIDNLIESD